LTFFDNYKEMGDGLDIDLAGNPDLALLPENGFRIACRFWVIGASRRLSKKAKNYLQKYQVSGVELNLNTVAEAGDIDGCTYAINGDCTPEAPSFQKRRVELYNKFLAVI